MNFTNRPVFLHDVPADKADGAAGEEPKKPDAGDNGGQAALTQEQVNDLVGRARKEGRDTGIQKLLEGFGLKSSDELKAQLEAAKKLQEAQMSETEKMTAKLKELEDKAAQLEASATERVTAMQKRILDSEIKMVAGRTATDKDNKVLRSAFRAEALDDVLLLIDRSQITEKDGSYTGIDKALEALAKAKPYLLSEEKKQPSYGTPSLPQQQAGQPKPEGPRRSVVGNSL